MFVLYLKVDLNTCLVFLYIIVRNSNGSVIRIPTAFGLFSDIVISVSALKVLFNNFMPQLDEIWTVPITVRHHGTSTVIYVDKPLPPTFMTTEDKTNIRCKRGTRFILQKPWSNQGNIGKKRLRGKKHSFSQDKEKEYLPDPVEPEKVSEGLFDDSSMDLSVLETFGTSEASTMQQVSSILVYQFCKH